VIRSLAIRVKVTLAFAAAMAVVLAIIGIAVYLRFASQLDETFNQGLRSRAGDVSALIQQRGGKLSAPGGSILVERGESFAQILGADGTVVDASPTLQAQPLLSARQVERGARETFIFTRPNPFEADEPARLLATPVTARDRRLIVVVGAGADDRNSQLASLALLLAIGGPVALLLASLAGYGVAAAALRPVDAMRRKAEAITIDEPGERLPVSGADDELARLGSTLNGMLARLEEAVQRERAFVADASHELRTPLAILTTEIELALRGERDHAELRAALESAAEETDRLAELADALLLLARADGDSGGGGSGLALVTAAVDVAELLGGVSSRLDAGVRARNRTLVVAGGDASARAAPLVGDARRLEQALGSLVENALLHGGGAIHLAAERRGNTVVLSVRDEGAGFEPGFIATAFERFARADPARGRGGAGLGLAIVRTIARAHGGEAHASNDPDGGARVEIVLPDSRRRDFHLPAP